MVTAFKKVEGVKDAKMDLAKVTVSVTYDPAKTEEKKILKSIDGSGYKAAVVEEKKTPKEGKTEQKTPEGKESK